MTQMTHHRLLFVFLISLCVCLLGDGIVTKGQGYGITSIRVDGNDALAVYNAIRVAREMAIKQQKPILVEVIIQSHHTRPHQYSTKHCYNLII